MTLYPSKPAVVAWAFHAEKIRLRIEEIVPLKKVTPQVYRSRKYTQIANSIREVGLVEPPVVAREADETFLLLDGHVRIHVLLQFGETEVDCLVARDDEAFTYNRRVNRLALVQEHFMIRRALERGASEEKLAASLSMDVSTLRQKRRLLVGICPEVVELLKDKHIAMNVFRPLRRMTPIRQIEAVELMISMNKYTISYAEALLAATPESQLLDHKQRNFMAHVSPKRLEIMEAEVKNLEREYRAVEERYGQTQLELIVAKAYVKRLLDNPNVIKYLASRHLDMLTGLQSVCPS